MKTGTLYAEIPAKSVSSPSRQLLKPILSNEHEDMPDWEDIAVNTAFVSKAVYYAGKEHCKTIVTTIDVFEWLKKHHYKIEKDMVRNMLHILSSTGIISRHNGSALLESWEWQLKEFH